MGESNIPKHSKKDRIRQDTFRFEKSTVVGNLYYALGNTDHPNYAKAVVEMVKEVLK